MKTRLRLLVALVLITMLVLAGAASAAEEPRPLSQVLTETFEAEGIEAADATYRRHRERGFVDVHESRADTAALAFRLLERNQTAAAVRVFRLNAETHPQSAAAWANLGEAYSVAGDRPEAEAAYRQAIELDARNRNARYGLARLSGRLLPPLPLLVLAHIAAGLLSILAGVVAMFAPKGRIVHRTAGKLFVGAMIAMSGSAIVRATHNFETEILNFWMGGLTLYLVITGWRAARFRQLIPTLLDWFLPLIALTTGAGLFALALGGGDFAGPATVFGIVAILAVVGDLRWFRKIPSDPARRIVRHLWRVGLGLFIAVGSFFLGQPHVFPLEIRSSGLLIVPPVTVILVIGFWLIRYRIMRRGRNTPALHPISSHAKP